MGNRVRSFLLFCSGANEAVLSKPECAHERNKYVGLGVGVLITALLAFSSGSYAFYSIYPSALLSLCLGLLFGLIILNLDRLIVSTLRKKKVAKDAPVSKRLQQKLHMLFCAFPRLLLGVFVSIIITIPIQLRLFEAEIKLQIAQSRAMALQEEVYRIYQEFPSLDQLMHETHRLIKDIIIAREKKQDAFEAARGELNGTTGTLVPGMGPVYKDRQEQLIRTDIQYEELRARNEPIIIQNRQLIESLAEQRDSLIEKTKESFQYSDGLLARIEALTELSERNAIVKWMNLLIILLFILLEITPILVHLLSGRGPYDDLLDSFAGRIEGDGAVAEGLIVIEHQGQPRSLGFGISILEFLLPARDQDHVIGDLLEEYNSLRSKHSSNARAGFWFYRQIFRSAASLLLKIFRDVIEHRIKKN